MLGLGISDMSNNSKSDTKQPLIGSSNRSDSDSNSVITVDIESSKKKSDFHFSHGLTSQEAENLLKKYGKNELPEKVIPKWYIFVQLLLQPMPIMIWLAALIELCIENFVDFAILIFIQFANASIAFYETTKAADAVAALKQSLKPEATVKRDGRMQRIDAIYLVPGDCVLLASGSAVPADTRVNEGQIDVDQAQLTGESLPVTMFAGDACLMGSTVVRGEVEGTVQFTGADTFFGKTASLLGQSNELSNLQKVLIKIVLVLTAASVFFCSIVFIYLVSTQSAHDALSFTVVLLVASIPMAIEIVTTTTLALGSKEMSHDGAIVSRLAAIEDMAGMAILCSDKTGTLTLNKMVIQEETPVYSAGETQYSLLRYAAMAARWKEPARDALDTLVLNAVDMRSLDKVNQSAFMSFDPVVKRTEGTVTDKGISFKVTKGAPHVLLKLCNDKQLEDRVTKQVETFGNRGIRCIAIAKTVNAIGGVDEWVFLGLLTFLDPPRPDTAKTIADASLYGVSVKMITGDHLMIARETAKALQMGDIIVNAEGLPLLDNETKKKPENLSRDYGDICLAADGFAQVFPEHKYLIVECLRELGYKVGMTGDGVNDAPALKRADVGIAVAGATDAARAAADIILTEEGLSTIINGIIISRKIFVRIRNFIIYRVAATLQLLMFFFISVFAFQPKDYMPNDWESRDDFKDEEWPDYFHLPVLMLMLITLLNDGTLIAIGYDNVVATKDPERWNIGFLFAIGSILAAVACISSLILLEDLLKSWDKGTMDNLDLGKISYGQITTAIYLKVSISDFLTLFSARTGENYFWSSKPAPILMGACVFSLSLSTVIACSWPDSNQDDVNTVGLLQAEGQHSLVVWVWFYCLLWWLVQDICKVQSWRLMKLYNVLEVNDTGKVVLPASTIRYSEKMRISMQAQGLHKLH